MCLANRGPNAWEEKKKPTTGRNINYAYEKWCSFPSFAGRSGAELMRWWSLVFFCLESFCTFWQFFMVILAFYWLRRGFSCHARSCGWAACDERREEATFELFQLHWNVNSWNWNRNWSPPRKPNPNCEVCDQQQSAEWLAAELPEEPQTTASHFTIDADKNLFAIPSPMPQQICMR